MSPGFLAEAFSQGCQWRDRIALEAGLLSDPDESKIPQLNPTPVGLWLGIGWQSRETSVSLNQWKEAKDKKSLKPLKRYVHLWLASRSFTSRFSHWLRIGCWQPGHPVLSRHIRRHATGHSLLLDTQGRGRKRRRYQDAHSAYLVTSWEPIHFSFLCLSP